MVVSARNANVARNISERRKIGWRTLKVCTEREPYAKYAINRLEWFAIYERIIKQTTKRRRTSFAYVAVSNFTGPFSREVPWSLFIRLQMQNLRIEKVLKSTNKSDVNLILILVQVQSVAMDQSVIMNRTASNHSTLQTMNIKKRVPNIPNPEKA